MPIHIDGLMVIEINRHKTIPYRIFLVVGGNSVMNERKTDSKY